MVHFPVVEPRADLLHLLPIVVVVADHHGHQLRRLEQRQDLAPAHLQEARGEGRVLLAYGVGEHVAQVSLHELLPETQTHGSSKHVEPFICSALQLHPHD